MFERKPEATPPTGKKGPIQGSNLAAVIVIGLMLLFFVVVVFGATIFFEIPFQLIVGWIIFLIANVTALEVNWEMTACGIGALLIAVFGLHRTLVWLRKDKAWKWSWTMSMTLLMLMLFAASISMTGIIHQIGWMVREPLTQSNNRSQMTQNISNAKQILYALVEYEGEHEKLPDSLEVLVSEGYITAGSMHELMFHPERGGTPEPWIYLGMGKTILYDDAAEGSNEFPLLISPQPIRGKWVVMQADGAIKQLMTKQVKKKYPWLLERLPHLIVR